MSFDFLIEMGGKSLAVTGIACLTLWLLRSRSSADRAAMVRLAMALLVALPIVSVALSALPAMPALQVERPDYSALVQAAPQPSATLVIVGADRPAASAPAAMPTERIALLVYAFGLLLVLVRLLAGLWTLRRWTVAAAPVTSSAWIAAFARASARTRRAPSGRLLVSASVSSPLSWGWRRPVILIDPDSLVRIEDADAILAHEFAHIARRDWPALMLSRLAVALFWFNPLVWLLERALIAQAEEAADLHALGWVEPVGYAQSLVACFRQAARRNERALVPANGMASRNGLARRVRAILDSGRGRTPSGSVWTLAAMTGCVAVTAPVAALKLVARPEPEAVSFDLREPSMLRLPHAPLPRAAPRPAASPHATRNTAARAGAAGSKARIVTIERRAGNVRVVDTELLPPLPAVPVLPVQGIQAPVPPVPPVPAAPLAAPPSPFGVGDLVTVTVGHMTEETLRRVSAATHRAPAAVRTGQLEASALRRSAQAVATAAMHDAARDLAGAQRDIARAGREAARAHQDVEDALRDLDE